MWCRAAERRTCGRTHHRRRRSRRSRQPALQGQWLSVGFDVKSACGLRTIAQSYSAIIIQVLSLSQCARFREQSCLDMLLFQRLSGGSTRFFPLDSLPRPCYLVACLRVSDSCLLTAPDGESRCGSKGKLPEAKSSEHVP